MNEYVAAKNLPEQLESNIFFGDTRVTVESFGEKKMMLVFFPGSHLKFLN